MGAIDPILAPSTGAELSSRTHRPRVLLVDDDQRNLMAISSILEDLADIVTCSSGEEALRELLRGEFAVILLDVIMPGMDGYETAQIIRQRKQTRRVPIIFLSAVNKDEPHLRRGYEMGAVDYVFKPVEATILRSKVSVFVDLFAMSQEIEERGRVERLLLNENLKAKNERLEALRELRAAEERQAAIIGQLPIVLYVDHGGETRRRELVSGAIEEVLGIGEADREMSVRGWLERVHPEDRDKVAATLRARDEKRGASLEYRLRKASDGSYIHVLDQSAPIAESPSDLAGTLFDISDRKALENQLLHARKMDAIGKLTGGIAHDFNNLLAAVIGGVTMVDRRCDLPEREKKIMSMTLHAAEQGSDLVKRMMAFSRTQTLEPETVDLPVFLDRVGELLEHTLGGKIELDIRVDHDIWSPVVDSSQLELSILNLAINARDAMPDGGRLEIVCANASMSPGNEHDLAPGDYIRVDVVDNGCGMSDDVIAKVMEPFFTTKDVGKGTGLGLSTVHGFVHQSGGTVELTSHVGCGTTVSLWIPRSTKALLRTEVVSEATNDAEQSLTVLLIDDHDGVRMVTAEMLQDMGHRVVEAASPREFDAILEQGLDQFDLLVTDLAMPLESGDQLIRRARQVRPDLRAIIITGHLDAEVLEKLPSDVETLSKPFTRSKFLRAINSSVSS